MPSLSEDKMAILFVAAVFIWTLVALPIMYLVEHWTADDIIALFTAVLAVSTIGLWLVTGQGIRAQARDTQILQRAYVAVEPLGIHSLKNSVEAVAHINIKNVGHLPARDVKWTIRSTVSDNNLLSDFPFDNDAPEGENTLPPGAAMRQGGGSINLDSEIMMERDKKLPYIYVWGAIFYKDGFDNSRTTHFCHRYNCNNISQQTSTTGFRRYIAQEFARYHPYGNNAD